MFGNRKRDENRKIGREGGMMYWGAFYAIYYFFDERSKLTLASSGSWIAQLCCWGTHSCRRHSTNRNFTDWSSNCANALGLVWCISRWSNLGWNFRQDRTGSQFSKNRDVVVMYLLDANILRHFAEGHPLLRNYRMWHGPKLHYHLLWLPKRWRVQTRKRYADVLPEVTFL